MLVILIDRTQQYIPPLSPNIFPKSFPHLKKRTDPATKSSF